MTEFFARLDADWLLTGDRSIEVFKSYLRQAALRRPLIIDLPRYHFVADFYSAEADKFQACAVFEEAPFDKESTDNIIKRWKEATGGKPVLLVFMDLPRRQGSTDLDLIGEDLMQAQERRRRDGQSFCVVKSEEDVFGVVCGHIPLYAQAMYSLENDLNVLKDDMKFLFEGRYQNFLEGLRHEKGCLTEASRAEICSRRSVQSAVGANSLWQCYNEAAKQKLFSANGMLKGWLEICNGFMRDWLEEKVLRSKNELLSHELIMKFNGYMMAPNGTFQTSIRPYEFADDMAYTRTTEDKRGRFFGIKPLYLARLRKFVEREAKDFLKVALMREYNSFERAINGGAR